MRAFTMHWLSMHVTAIATSRFILLEYHLTLPI